MPSPLSGRGQGGACATRRRPETVGPPRAEPACWRRHNHTRVEGRASQGLPRAEGTETGPAPTNRAPPPQRPEGDSADRPLNPRCSPGPTPRVCKGARAGAVGRPHETGPGQLPPAMGPTKHLPFCQGQDPACSRKRPDQAPPVAHPAHRTTSVSPEPPVATLSHPVPPRGQWCLRASPCTAGSWHHGWGLRVAGAGSVRKGQWWQGHRTATARLATRRAVRPLSGASHRHLCPLRCRRHHLPGAPSSGDPPWVNQPQAPGCSLDSAGREGPGQQQLGSARGRC